MAPLAFAVGHILEASQGGDPPGPLSHEVVLLICFGGALLCAVVFLRWRRRNSNGPGLGFGDCARKLVAKLTGRPSAPTHTLPASMTTEMLQARQVAISAPPPDIAETYFEPLPRYTPPSNPPLASTSPQPPPPAYIPSLHNAPPYSNASPPPSADPPNDDVRPPTPNDPTGPIVGSDSVESDVAAPAPGPGALS